MKNFILLITLLTTALPTFADEQRLRYRGQYTFGHEVNTFCPAINSQCYWLGPETAPQQRQLLKQLSANNTSRAYEAICIVVEGRINRDPEVKNSIGFATQYDGLFTVTEIFGLCSKTGIVTHGDLQHHRWLLESINGNNINAEKLDNKIPEIDFGAQMTVTGNTGCNTFSAQAMLQGDQLVIGPVQSTMMFCTPPQNELELKLKQVLNSDPKITMDDKNNLVLEAGDTRLKYRLKDWVR
ncbi:MAG: META domain-containing protein [Gammaproteobacteria bacterium]